MKHITFYFDFISPYAFLAFEKLPRTLDGLSYLVTYKPVLFGALLKHNGQLGPAEIKDKRTWTYRHAQWLAEEQKTDYQLPLLHPFSSLALLRLALACGRQGVCSRWVCETIFRHVWQTGLDAADSERLKDLTLQLAPSVLGDSAAVKEQLRKNTESAIAIGVFGVPTYEVDGELFWGLDALPMLSAYLRGSDFTQKGAWKNAPTWGRAKGL